MSGSIPAPTETDLGRIVRGVRDLFAGRSNAFGRITLTVSATTTVVTAANCAINSEIFLTPRTANAAAVLASTFISATAAGSFTVTHPSNVNADKTFGYRIGG